MSLKLIINISAPGKVETGSGLSILSDHWTLESEGTWDTLKKGPGEQFSLSMCFLRVDSPGKGLDSFLEQSSRITSGRWRNWGRRIQKSVRENRLTEQSSWDLILLGTLCCRSNDHPGWPRPHLLCLGEPPKQWLPYVWVSHITTAHCGTLSCWMNPACLGRYMGMETGQLSRSPGRLWGPVIRKHLLPAPQLNKRERLGGGGHHCPVQKVISSYPACST